MNRVRKDGQNIVKGYRVYTPRLGLEGPLLWRNGRVVYWDWQEGSYYDPDTDLLIPLAEVESQS